MDPVRFRDCACPGQPHPDGDTVTFKPKLSFDENVAAFAAIFSPPNPGAVAKAWSVYLHAGPVAWNLLDDEGRAIPLTAEALDGLDFADQYAIANAADDIYGETVVSPFSRAMATSSATSPTPAGSRRRSTSGGTTRARRKSSS